MFFFGKDDLGLAIRFRNKNYGTMLSLAFAITVELSKNRTVGTRGRSSTSSALAAVLLYRSLRHVRNVYRSSRKLMLLLTVSSHWQCWSLQYRSE
jgi:hypothetical protein